MMQRPNYREGFQNALLTASNRFAQALDSERENRLRDAKEEREKKTFEQAMKMAPYEERRASAQATGAETAAAAGKIELGEAERGQGLRKQLDEVQAIPEGIRNPDKEYEIMDRLLGKPVGFHKQAETERVGKVGREAEAHTSAMQTDTAQRGYIGAQTKRALAEAQGGTGDANWQVTDTSEGKVQVNPKTGETRPLTGPDGKQLRSPKEPGIKLNEAQTKTLGAAGMAKTMLNDLAAKFKGGGLGGVGGFVADVAESVPFVGGKVAPKTAEYNDQRRIVAETFLREATGAAAPAPEVKFYTNLLPEPGDSEAQAQSALNAFRGAVKAKVKGVAETLRAQGREADAQNIEQNLETLFADSENIKTSELEDLSDDEIDSQLRAKGIDPVTGKKLRMANGAQ